MKFSALLRLHTIWNCNITFHFCYVDNNKNKKKS